MDPKLFGVRPPDAIAFPTPATTSASEMNPARETVTYEVDSFPELVEQLRVLNLARVPWEVRSFDRPAPFGAPGDIDRTFIVSARS